MPISAKADNPEFRQKLADAWLNIAVDNNRVFNPLDWPSDYDEFPEKYISWVLTRPEYFSFICSEILNVHLIPTQALMLKELWHRKFPMLIACRGFGKSYMLAVYALLRILLMPNRKVVVAGAAFRQSKVIFEYIEAIYYNAPILQDIIGTSKKVIRHDTDLYRFRIGESVCTAIPIGDGSKIRGQRANDLITDEFACIDKDSLVETTNGLVRISDFNNIPGEILTGDKNISEPPTKYIKTPLCDVYEVKFDNGYIIKCSEQHKLMTNLGWCSTLNLRVGDFVEKADKKFEFNVGQGYNTPGLDKKYAWLMGILVSEGCITHNSQIQVTTTDKDISEKLINNYGFKVKITPAYIDDRGWNCKLSYRLWLYDKELRQQLYEWGLDYVTAHGKKIPWSILQSNFICIQSFLSGLFEGDGSSFLWEDRGKDRIGLAYYSVSERLCRDVQVLMLKLGYDGYITKRKSNLSDNDQWMVRWNNQTARNASIELRVERFKNAIDNCELPTEYTNICWDKSRNKWKVNYVYLDKTIQKRFKDKNKAEIFVRELRARTQYRKIVSITKLDYQDHLYDYYLPQSNSFYADGIRQHNSIPKQIFENVLAGFAAVKSHPIEGVYEAAEERMARELGVWEDEVDTFVDDIRKDNQIVISGTAYYDFNHFGQYWRDWHEIICTRGNKRKLKEYFKRKAQEEQKQDTDIPEEFHWSDYSIIRIPFELVPHGFMDGAQVARSKATIHAGIYSMEFGAVFSTDSNGFFKRTLIESCVASQLRPISFPSGDVFFEGMLSGNPSKRYVFGVDPASEIDNFSIIVIEINLEHRRIVYGWTTNRDQHKEEIKAGLIKELDFYSYCAKKIRGLMVRFPCERIMMDAQGGGIAVMEALHDTDKYDVESGEQAIWPAIDPMNSKDTDVQTGLHLVELVQFASADWTYNANHGMRKDLEDKALLFPYFDPITLANAAGEDKISKRMYDTMEDCVMELEELKDELSLIIITQTVSGRDKWDTPEIKLPGGRKGRLRKDRYSAVVMANMGARELHRAPKPTIYNTVGGFAGDMKQQEGPLYSNEHFNNWAKEFYGV